MNKFLSPLTMSLLLAFATLSACSSIDKYNPFTETPVYQEIPRTPAGSTEYLCEGNKRFYVRMLDKGNGAWLIYPDREINLDKVSGAGNRYSNGVAMLEINGNEANLSDGPKIDYKGCQAVVATKK